jgi:gas vesicle protein
MRINGYRNSKFASTKGKAEMPETKVSKREEYVAKMKDQLDDIKEKIDKQEEKSKGTRADLANKYKQEMAGIWR